MRLSKKKIEQLLSSDTNNKNYFENFCEFWLPIYKHQVIEAKLEENKNALSEIMLNIIKNIHLTEDEKRYIAKRIGIYYLVEKSENVGFEKSKKQANEVHKVTKVCKCSNRIHFMKLNQEYKICEVCGRKVFRNMNAEFREKLKQKMKEKNYCNVREII